MALEGTLRDFSFADILQLISLQRKTGVLTLKSEENVVTISFLDGCLVGSSSLNQHAEDRLGLILLKKGLLAEAELEAALRRQEETLQRLGRILIDHHVVSPDDVRSALQQQILQVVYRVFRWGDGEYHFSQETDIDFDRDLMIPMAADSIIMEGARMTDEWPFIDQRIPDREVVFVKVDTARRLEVVEGGDDDFDDLGFKFADSPDDAKVADSSEDRVTANQYAIYEVVNGRDSVNEIIQESPLIEFDTCKALADLIDRGLVRRATADEVARQLRRAEEGPERGMRVPLGSLPWLAIPFLVLLGFSLTIMSHNPMNPSFTLPHLVWDRYVLEAVSWYWMDSLASAAETSYFLSGLYPDSVEQVAGESRPETVSTDPWGRQYRLVTRGHKLLVTGFDHAGQPVPMLILSRSMAWESAVASPVSSDGPGVILLDSG